MSNARYTSDENCPFGKLQLTAQSDSPRQLLCDGTVVSEGQVLLVKFIDGVTPFCGRLALDTKGEWYLECQQFVGHSYLNIPFIDGYLDDVVAKVCREV